MKAPTSTVGSSPALISRCPSSAVVVDLPCVPVTARPILPSAVISSPSTACHGTIGRPRSRAADQLGEIRHRPQRGRDRHTLHAFQVARVVAGQDADAGGLERWRVWRGRVRVTSVHPHPGVVHQQRDPGGAGTGNPDDVDAFAGPHHGRRRLNR